MSVDDYVPGRGRFAREILSVLTNAEHCVLEILCGGIISKAYVWGLCLRGFCYV